MKLPVEFSARHAPSNYILPSFQCHHRENDNGRDAIQPPTSPTSSYQLNECSQVSESLTPGAAAEAAAVAANCKASFIAN